MAAVAISIDNNRFTPADVVINRGDTVTWTNNHASNGQLIGGGQAAGPADAGTLANGGVGTYAYTFTITGTFSMSYLPLVGLPFTGAVEVI